MKQKVRVGDIWVLFFGSLSLILVSKIVGLFDTSTELFPTHVRIETSCLALAAVGGLVACGMAIYLTRGLTVIQRVVLPLVIMFETALGIFLVSSQLASIVEGWVDFPAGKTYRRQELMSISRAYQTHGKGSSQYIQTMPYGFTLEITPEDFAFMRNHRRPDDDGKKPDEILSNSYFCAKVTVELTGKAERVLHSGSQELPQGTVILCPVLILHP